MSEMTITLKEQTKIQPSQSELWPKLETAKSYYIVLV